MKNFKCYKKMLIIDDMVNGFVKFGALHDEKIAEVVPYQLKLVQKAIANDDLLVFIKDTHTPLSVEHKRFGGLFHCLRGSGEEKLISEFQPYEKDGISFEKNSTSFMFAKEFISMLDSCENLERVDVCGCCTDICITNGVIPMANYFDENNRDVAIYVHEQEIETYNSEFHDRDTYSNASKLLIKQQGIHLI